jgi:hypothetical protein
MDMSGSAISTFGLPWNSFSFADASPKDQETDRPPG